MIPARIGRLVAALAALPLAVVAHPTLAAPLLQDGGRGGNDRMKVIVITLLAVAAAMILLAIGYVYRRTAGVDKPPPAALLEPGEKITGD